MLLPLLAQEAGWSWQNPMPQGNDLNALHVVDDHTIVAAGTVGTIIMTTDGGANWTMLDSGVVWDFEAVWFRDAQNGWVAGQRGLLRTTDGGVTWNRVPSISENDFIFALYFADAQTGWAAGGLGKVFKTTNGGASWTPQSTGLPITAILEDIYFVDATHGWVVGSAGTIFRTTDGGANWEPAISGVSSPLRKVHFSDRDHGWIVGTSGTLLQSTDGGQTWTPRTPSLGIGENAAAVHFNDALEGWLVTTIRIWKTIDGGENWENRARLGLPDGRALTVMDFRDPGNLWVAGYGGAAYKSIDGGETWTHQTPGLRLSWGDAAFVNAHVGWVVGELGSIYKTADGGLSWSQQPLPDNFTSGFLSVHFADDQTGWVAGATGRIYHTANGGETWVRQTSGSTRTLRSSFFLNAQTGWVAGDSGTILHTNNGGQDWTPQTSDVTTGLRAIQFVDANTGWAAGLGSTVLRTTNGGEEWFPAEDAPTGNLHALHFVNSQMGFITGVGTIHRTLNGGADWTATTFPLNAFQNLNTVFNSVHFVDASHGWVVGASGVIARTADGGENWELIFNPIQNPVSPPTPRMTEHGFQAVVFVDSDTGWAVGAFGSIIRHGHTGITAPTLRAEFTAAGLFRIAWPQDGNDWTLLSADAPTATAWNPVTAGPVDGGGASWIVEFPTEAPAQYFRLERVAP